jgi:hypothetical protein
LLLRSVCSWSSIKVFERPLIGSHHHHAGQFAVFGGDARRQVAAQAVAHQVDLLGIDRGLRAQEGQRGDGIVHGFVVGRVWLAGHALGILPDALFIAQHDHAARGQAVGKIAEGLEMTACESSRSYRPEILHQQHGRERTGAFGHGQRARQLPFVVAEGHGALRKGIRLAVSRARPFRFAGIRYITETCPEALMAKRALMFLSAKETGMVTTLVGPISSTTGSPVFSTAPHPLIWAPSLPKACSFMLVLSCWRRQRGELGIILRQQKVERLPRDRGRVRGRLREQNAN